MPKTAMASISRLVAMGLRMKTSEIFTLVPCRGGLQAPVAYVIMANHVHVLMLPRSDLSKIMQTLKGYPAALQTERLRHGGGTRDSVGHGVRIRGVACGRRGMRDGRSRRAP